ncbi:MAG: hypothetical protein AMXMBFR59_18730 [Rhodanobacteraceae bacterium]
MAILCVAIQNVIRNLPRIRSRLAAVSTSRQREADAMPGIVIGHLHRRRAPRWAEGTSLPDEGPALNQKTPPQATARDDLVKSRKLFDRAFSATATISTRFRHRGAH